MRLNEAYMNRKNRDARYRELTNQYGKSNVSRSSIRNQLLHPQYVVDFTGPEKNDTGFGNTVYKTYFKALYIVEVRS